MWLMYRPYKWACILPIVLCYRNLLTVTLSLSFRAPSKCWQLHIYYWDLFTASHSSDEDSFQIYEFYLSSCKVHKGPLIFPELLSELCQFHGTLHNCTLTLDYIVQSSCLCFSLVSRFLLLIRVFNGRRSRWCYYRYVLRMFDYADVYRCLKCH